MPTAARTAENGWPLLIAAGLALVLAACSGGGRYSQRHDSAPRGQVDISRIPDATPRIEARSRYGNPASYVVRGRRYYTLASSRGYRERGIASWYGTKFHGHRTSSGETYDMYAMTAAHKTLPLPTYARVTNLRNGRSVVVRINDRGPFHDNRLIDLSYAAAMKLDIVRTGTGLVEVEAIDPAAPATRQTRAPAITAPVSERPASRPRPDRRARVRRQPELYLQVGAFSSRTNAEQLQRRLAATAPAGKLRISKGVSNNRPIYRVRIGPLETVELADSLARNLMQHGIESPHVVID